MKNVITLQDKEYPYLLKEIPNAPKALYYKGEWDEDIFENCLAVVGARRMTSYGRRVGEQIVREIAKAGITIVSGFMYGIDALSHAAAVKSGGRTIAVMPCGIDLIHPSYQKDLYKEILENQGLIVSEYEGKTPPRHWIFSQRNRIVAGLTKAVLVVEAGEKSGSLITANYAKQYKRKIFAIPGSLTSELSRGTNKLLKEGAEIVTSAQDVLSFYGLSYNSVAEHARGNLQGLEKQIVEYLLEEPMEIDTLAQTLEMPVAEVGTALTLLEINGLILEEDGKYHAG